MEAVVAVNDKKYWSVAELQAHLGICRDSAYQLVNREDFPKVKVGNRIIISIAAFDDWFNNHIGDSIPVDTPKSRRRR